MRILILVLSFFFVMISCKTEPQITVIKPHDFDKKAYTTELKEARETQVWAKQEKEKITKKKTKETIVEEKEEEIIPIAKTPEIIQRTDTIRVNISYGKAKIDTIKTAGQKLLFVFDSDTAKKLKLKVEPADSTGNLRISQIFRPGGSSDGPFGKTVEFPSDTMGIYKVLVSESGMQGDTYSGRLTFEVNLEW